MTTPSETALSAEWATLRDSLSKAYVAADIDAALRYSRPRIEAAARSQPATELRDTRFAWLIERGSGPVYWDGDAQGNGHWVASADRAGKFSTREQAEEYRTRFSLSGRVVEHGWVRAARSQPATEGLDAAWAEAEAALPRGWTLLVGREVNRPYAYWATATSPRAADHTYTIVSTSHDGTLELTPQAALRSLVALLAATEPAGDERT